jgi:hypothetical protein
MRLEQNTNGPETIPEENNRLRAGQYEDVFSKLKMKSAASKQENLSSAAAASGKAHFSSIKGLSRSTVRINHSAIESWKATAKATGSLEMKTYEGSILPGKIVKFTHEIELGL